MAPVVVELMTTTARDLQLADGKSAVQVVLREEEEDGSRAMAMSAPPADKAAAFAVEEPPVDDEEALAERQAAVARLLAGFRRHLEDRSAHHLGYPYNLAFDLAPLAPFLLQGGLCINNLGDPFVESNYGVHSRPMEVAVLDWFAGLWDLAAGDYWGYVTSCGTEGNLHGLLVCREVFPDGVMYASADSHYSSIVVVYLSVVSSR